MKCVICKQGDLQTGTTTVTLERDPTTLVCREVPAEVCDNCGEAFLDEDVATRLWKTADEAARAGVELDVRRYLAA